MTMTRPLVGSQVPGLAALGIGTAVSSYGALELLPVPREWQVGICLALVAVLGAIAGVAVQHVKWSNAAIVLTAASTVVFAASCFSLYETGRWWILATLLFLPGVALVAFVSTRISRAFAVTRRVAR